MPRSTQLVVFSDLDGTLLDHASYSWDPAQPALAALAGINAPVILSSSKTASEIAVLQEEMGLGGLAGCVGSGGGLGGLGAGAVAEQDAALRAGLDDVPPVLRALYTGFGDMNVAGVIEATGLSQEEAARAKDRAFSEPGLWAGTDAQQEAFVTALAAKGITARHGGRFLTLSFGKTKADRMAEVIAHFQPAHTIALGDAPNDVEMLEAADHGVIIANPHRPPLPKLKGEDAGRIRRTDQAGPLGWDTAICALLEDLGYETGTE